MPRFDAAHAIEPLAYDFTTHPQYDGTAPGKGNIREFTDADLREFSKGISKVLGKAGEVDDVESAKGQRQVSSMMADGTLAETIEEMTQVIATFCAGSPSEAEMMGLPVPTRRAFFDWLLESLFSPKAKTDASVRPRR